MPVWSPRPLTFTSIPKRTKAFFKRKPDLFISRLQEQSALSVQGAEALVDYMAKPSKKTPGASASLRKTPTRSAASSLTS